MTRAALPAGAIRTVMLSIHEAGGATADKNARIGAVSTILVQHAAILKPQLKDLAAERSRTGDSTGSSNHSSASTLAGEFNLGTMACFVSNHILEF